MNTLIVWGSVIIGLLLLAVAFEYGVTPAGSLPSVMPGFDATVDPSHIHYKHAIGSFVLALALFAFAWFQSGPKKTV